MPAKIIDDLSYLGAGLAAFLAVGIWIRRAFGNMRGEDAVLTSMREEIERLADTNTKLSHALGDLQNEIISLRNENITLHGEIAALRNENARLTREVLKLNEQIERLAKGK